jgi:hypothetical protein
MSWEGFWSSLDESLGFRGPRGKKKDQELMNQQIKDYQEQSKLAKEEMTRAKDAQVAEKRRIQEKQIRSLRRHSSSRGFLGTSNDMAAMNQSSSLGG